MFRKNNSAEVLLIAILVGVLSATSSLAAILTTNVAGQLTGATGVVVGGGLYDVSFQDGTCIALYTGCDDVGDFVFTSQMDAALASHALLDQVLLDGGLGLFDSDASATFGCERATFVQGCRILTAHGLSNRFGVPRIDLTIAVNANGAYQIQDSIDTDLFSLSKTVDFTTDGQIVYAVWTIVPEPGSGFLLGMGIAGLSASRRKTCDPARKSGLARGS